MQFIYYLTSFLLFFLPFQFALGISSTIDLAIIRLIILVIFLIYVTIAFFKKDFFIPKGIIAILSFLFLFWITFSLFYTPVFNWTLRKIFFLFSIGVIFLVFTGLFQHYKTKGIDTLLKFLILGATTASIIAIIQFFSQFIFSLETILNFWLSLTPFFLGGTFSEAVIEYNSWLVNVAGINLLRATAFFPDPHIFSFYCGLSAPLALALFFQSKKYFWLISFFLIILADLLTFTRGGYFGLLIGFIVTIILFWSQLKTFYKHLLTVILIGLILILFIPNNFFINRFNSSFDYQDNSVIHRLELWSETTKIIKDNLLLGVGLGAYSHEINPRADYRMPIYAHNTYLDIWVEVGIIGFLIFSSLLISVWLNFYRQRNKILPKFAIISLAIFTTHLFFDTPIFSVHILPIFIFIIALGSYYENQTISPNK